ncbi:hypothetical protein SAMN05660845_1460 [Flavobacterium swingsii]|uniref:Uncharacterized protein n=1 Tax=Flavobacterium swingsii TaxID=498292 RepID=A0A1I0XV64_9FLAO|nr:hypothetical protein [Flavobacterium swingsii]SFB03863.1 hypothetical protein SAMN05660845_1460 [Flavobacterium swingsii]
MKILNKILKIVQSIVNVDFKKTAVKSIKKESLKVIEFKYGSESNDSESLLFLINGQEDEFLFI